VDGATDERFAVLAHSSRGARRMPTDIHDAKPEAWLCALFGLSAAALLGLISVAIRRR
jgi:hypothetical protein